MRKNTRTLSYGRKLSSARQSLESSEKTQDDSIECSTQIAGACVSQSGQPSKRIKIILGGKKNSISKESINLEQAAANEHSTNAAYEATNQIVSRSDADRLIQSKADDVQSFLDCNSSFKVFNEHTKDDVVQFVANLDVSTHAPNTIHSLKLIFESPYFHFVSNKLRSFLFKILSFKTDIPKESKLLAGEYLNRYFCSVDNFRDMAALYSTIDTFKVSRTTFRNNILLQTLADIFVRSKDKNQLLEALEQCFRCFPQCISFVEFLCKNPSNFVCRHALILYCFDFLRNIKVDLLSIKNAEDIKEVDESVISRIFLSFSEIYNESTCDSFDIKTSERLVDESKHNIGSDNKHTGANQSLSSTLIFSLFNSENTRSILLSVYKRLFFFFLFKQKRIFQGLKIFNIFTKEEKSSIYKNIKKYRLSFINIFKQIDQGYLLRSINNSVSDVSSVNGDLILAIKEERLDEEGLRTFYSSYFFCLENSRASLKIKCINLEIFCEEFNSRLDKSIIKYIKISENTSSDHYTLNGLKFIHCITKEMNSTVESKGCIDTSLVALVDAVRLVSLIVDDPSSLVDHSKTEYFNVLLCILFNGFRLLNSPLIMRLLPVLRKALAYKDYTMNAGRLYNRVYEAYNFRDPLYSDDAYSAGASVDRDSNNISSLLVKSAINHPSFQSTFNAYTQKHVSEALPEKDIAESQHSLDKGSGIVDTLPPFERGVVSSSLVFYIQYNPHFSLSFPSILVDTLKRKNQSTKYLLSILKENISHCSSFITRNIGAIQELFFHFEKQNGSIVYPFEWDILEILFESLKAKIILPCMAIPYILCRKDCLYIFKNCKESCINCINDCTYIVRRRIVRILSSYKNDASNNENNDNNKSYALVDLSVIDSLFDFELSNNFFSLCSNRVSLKKTIEKVDYQNDCLVVYIVLRSLRLFNKKDKEIVIKHITENVGDEKIFEIVEKTKEYYEKNPRGVLPVDYIL